MPNWLKYSALISIAVLLFFPYLGGVHLFDWDEINFAECAREMIVSKDYLRAQVDFMPFWEKPPIFIWMQVASMKLFGVGAYAARFPNAIIGVLTLLSLWHIGKKVMNERVALWWVGLYLASWLPHFYFKTGIIDPTFNLFIFWAFYQMYALPHARVPGQSALLAGLFLGLAVLTKGPVAILVSLIAFGVYVIIKKGMGPYKWQHLLLIFISACLPFIAWFLVAAAVHGFAYGQWFITEFVAYQIRLLTTEDSDHGGPFIYHFVVLLVGCFPASAYLFQFKLKRPAEVGKAGEWTLWMWILFWVVLILFSIVKTKIVHYSSLCYFPITFLAALQLYRITDYKEAFLPRTRWVFLGVGLLMGILLLAAPIVGMNKGLLVPLIVDPFAVGNLQAQVPWNYAHCLLGAGYISALGLIFWWMGKDNIRSIWVTLAIQVVAIQVGLFMLTPRIEGYSQRAAIDFYKSFQGKEVYIRPLGFKSYAFLYYAEKTPSKAKEYYGTDVEREKWLLEGAVDRPVYFICKIQDSAQFAAFKGLEVIGNKNGFVFLKRTQLGTQQ